jgi:hypothetical protein
MKNSPDVLVPMTIEQAEFILKHCMVNQRMCLANLQSVSEKTARELVSMIENYKAVQKAIQTAAKEAGLKINADF